MEDPSTPEDRERLLKSQSSSFPHCSDRAELEMSQMPDADFEMGESSSAD